MGDTPEKIHCTFHKQGGCANLFLIFMKEMPLILQKRWLLSYLCTLKPLPHPSIKLCACPALPLSTHPPH